MILKLDMKQQTGSRAAIVRLKLPKPLSSTLSWALAPTISSRLINPKISVNQSNGDNHDLHQHQMSFLPFRQYLLHPAPVYRPALLRTHNPPGTGSEGEIRRMSGLNFRGADEPSLRRLSSPRSQESSYGKDERIEGGSHQSCEKTVEGFQFSPSEKAFGSCL